MLGRFDGQSAFKIGKASMMIVAPGTLGAMNSLDKPDAIKPEKGEVKINGQKVNFELPALSAAVVTIESE